MENNIFTSNNDGSVIITFSAFFEIQNWVDGDTLAAFALTNHIKYNLESTLGRDIITAQERLCPKHPN